MTPEQEARLPLALSELESHKSARPSEPEGPVVPKKWWRDHGAARRPWRAAELQELVGDAEAQALAAQMIEHQSLIEQFKISLRIWAEELAHLRDEVDELRRAEGLQRAWENSCALELRRALVKGLRGEGMPSFRDLCVDNDIDPEDALSPSSAGLDLLAAAHAALIGRDDHESFAAALPSKKDHDAFQRLRSQRPDAYEELRRRHKGNGPAIVKSCASLCRVLEASR